MILQVTSQFVDSYYIIVVFVFVTDVIHTTHVTHIFLFFFRKERGILFEHGCLMRNLAAHATLVSFAGLVFN